jgi:hypothetical protein
MGEQHYKINGWHISRSENNNTTVESELQYQKLKDRYKKFIAYKNGYGYLELPYWTFDESETFKKIIKSKLELSN